MDFDKRTFGKAVLVFWVVVLTILFFVFSLPTHAAGFDQATLEGMLRDAEVRSAASPEAAAEAERQAKAWDSLVNVYLPWLRERNRLQQEAEEAAVKEAAYRDALTFELGFGETHYIKQTDGVWYQDAFPYTMDTEDQSLSLGVSWQPGTIRYRAEFLVLGKHFVNALATSDGTYNPHFVTHCGDACGLVALQGRGSVSGLLLSASRNVYGPLYVEAGVYANVKKWQITVTQLDGTLLGEAQREHQIDFGPVVGLGMRYNGLDVGVQYIYLDDSSEGDPITPMMTGAYRGYIKVYF